jgi:hypothetical protein
MNPFRRMVTVGHNAGVFIKNTRQREQEETAIRGRYVTQCVVLTPGAEYSVTRVSLTALTEPFRLDGDVIC